MSAIITTVPSQGFFSLTYSNPANVIFNADLTNNDSYSLIDNNNNEFPFNKLTPAVSIDLNYITENITTQSTGIAIDSKNNMYVSNTGNTINVYDSTGVAYNGIITIGNGSGNIQTLCIYNDYLYIPSFNTSYIYRVDLNNYAGGDITVTTYYIDSSAADASIVHNAVISVNYSYIVCISSTAAEVSVILIYSYNQQEATATPTFVSKITNTNNYGTGISIDSNNNIYFIGHNTNIYKYTYNEWSSSSNPAEIVNFGVQYYRLLIDNNNTLYVSPQIQTEKIYLIKFPLLNGNYNTDCSFNYIGTAPYTIQSTALDTNGNVYVVNTTTQSIIKITMPNTITFDNIVVNSSGTQSFTIKDTTLGAPVTNSSFTLDIVKVTTYPNPIIAGEAVTIIYTSLIYIPVANNQYYLLNQLGYKVSGIYTGVQNEINFTFNNVYLSAGLNILSIYNNTTDTNGPVFTESSFDVSTVCFKEGTKILCHFQSGSDIYINIESLTDNLYIKTYKNGYKKIKYILKSQLLNSAEKTINKLYRMKKTKSNELIEDLYVTGSHAIIKDKLTDKEERKMTKLLDSVACDIEYNRFIDGKAKLVACFDERFEEFNEEGYYNIYHLVLEHDSVFKNYVIYANGLPTESTDELTLHRMTDFNIINFGYKMVHTMNTKSSYKDNMRIMTKSKTNASSAIPVDINAVILKKKYLEEEKQKRENLQHSSLLPSPQILKTYKKTPSKINQTYRHK